MITTEVRMVTTKHEMLTLLIDIAERMTGDCFRQWLESIPEGEPSAEQLKSLFDGFADCMKQEGIW